jgi:D-sedoheptulose 7-phosphate isomerase
MKSFSEIYQEHLCSHKAAVDGLEGCIQIIEQMAQSIIGALRKGNKVIFFGNGGSADDAQHLAAEFVIRYKKNRRSLPALALTTDTSMLTACGNDFGFETIFARQVESLAQPGDIAIGITTSGNSENVLRGLEAAKTKGCHTIAWTAADGGKAQDLAAMTFRAPSGLTAHAQECHMIVGHLICGLVDESFPA